MSKAKFELSAKHFLGLAVIASSFCATGSGHQRLVGTVTAEARAVAFLIREVPAWSKANGCFSCHNNGDAARVLYTASRQGHQVPANALAATTAWVGTPNRWEQNKGDPGFSDKRLADPAQAHWPGHSW